MSLSVAGILASSFSVDLRARETFVRPTFLGLAAGFSRFEASICFAGVEYPLTLSCAVSASNCSSPTDTPYDVILGSDWFGLYREYYRDVGRGRLIQVIQSVTSGGPSHEESQLNRALPLGVGGGWHPRDFPLTRETRESVARFPFPGGTAGVSNDDNFENTCSSIVAETYESILNRESRSNECYDGCQCKLPSSSTNIRLDDAAMYSGCVSCCTANGRKAGKLLHDILVNRSSKGVRCSPFHADLEALKHSMSLHGLYVDAIVKRSEARNTLLHHILSGKCCVETDPMLEGMVTVERPACRVLAQEYSTAAALSTAAFDAVIRADDSDVPTENLAMICYALSGGTESVDNMTRTVIKRKINVERMKICRSADGIESSREIGLMDIVRNIDKMRRNTLVNILSKHGEEVNGKPRRDVLAERLLFHVFSGKCGEVDIDQHAADHAACREVVDEYLRTERCTSGCSVDDIKVFSLRKVAGRVGSQFVRSSGLRANNIIPDSEASLSLLRTMVLDLIRQLVKNIKSNKKLGGGRRKGESKTEDEWPQKASKELKESIYRRFRDATSSQAWSRSTCASCGESCPVDNCKPVDVADIDLNLLKRPDVRELAGGSSEEPLIADPDWLFSSLPEPPLPAGPDVLKDVLFAADGLLYSDCDNVVFNMCSTCLNSLKRGKVPALALSNHNYLGDVPEELRGLTVVEEAMIARCRAKCWIVQLTEDDQDVRVPNTQRGIKGNIIVYPQEVSTIARCLPPTLEEVSAPICVIFVGSKPPTDEWLRNKAKPLVVRREKVRRALEWLKIHNPLYSELDIDYKVIESLEYEQIIPVEVQHITPKDADSGLQSTYDVFANQAPVNLDGEPTSSEIPFQNVVIADADGNWSGNELRAKALRHLKVKGGGYLEIPHDPDPVNEFDNPEMFPMLYPTLFPYGLGGVENMQRTTRLSMKRQVKHMFKLHDMRFQEHYSFLFTAFNILQRRKALLHTYLMTQKGEFSEVARDLSLADSNVVSVVCDRVKNGDIYTANNDEERRVLRLIQRVNTVTSHVPGSSASKVTQRNEIRAMMMEHGLPSFYITINPADVTNPLVNLLAGADIDVDRLTSDNIPGYWDQSVLLAKNPAVGATFFNQFIKAFISVVLAYDPSQEDVEGGALGVVKGYYGCVEAQGRGSLHCHMLVWVQGGLNPNEIKKRIIEDGDVEFSQRLLEYLDDLISNSIPEDPEPDIQIPASNHHPCSVKGVDLDLQGEEFERARQKDRHFLAQKCQQHKHTKTCFKYSQDECRFDLDPENVRLESYVDYETGEICLRCLDGMVNNYNDTIMECMRCNSDIQFIGSGASAKAILYYITDYITKSQLTTHVAFTALKLAVQRVEELESFDEDVVGRAKRLLQKGAYSMLSRQELSAQQVASYLMDFEDHFTSHKFTSLPWRMYEKYVEVQDVSLRGPIAAVVGDVDVDSGICRDNSDSENPYKDSNKCGSPMDVDDPVPTELETPDPPGDGFEYVSDMSERYPVVGRYSPEYDDVLDDSQSAYDYDGNGLVLPEEELNQSADVPCNGDEIRLFADSKGDIYTHASQIDDYLYRDQRLGGISLWDFVAQFEKVKRQRTMKRGTREVSNEEDSMFQEALSGRFDDCDSDSDDDDILDDCERNRPRYGLIEPHLDALTHELKLRKPLQRRVPVPIGPGIPRRNRDDVRERYCRLMLILFKPWRKLDDLKYSSDSWNVAFDEFNSICNSKIAKVMDNMQLLHECKDARDDHYTQRRHRNRERSFRIAREFTEVSGQDGVLSGDFDSDELALMHLMSIDETKVASRSFAIKNVKNCLKHAENGGMLIAGDSEKSNTVREDIKSLPPPKQVAPDGLSLEEEWRTAYDLRKEMHKRRSKNQPLYPVETERAERTEARIRDGISLRYSDGVVRDVLNPIASVRKGKGRSDQSTRILADDIDAIIGQFTLNREQARAFRIVAEHSAEDNPEQLRMFLGGAGGTGKSQVIDALRAFFELRDEARRLRLSSFTGVAAKHISGVTLHSALSLGIKSRGAVSGKARSDLISTWVGVDYLFIDEISMVGCKLLLDVSRALCVAKENSTLFGGVNVIFAGDFAQLRPVNHMRLFSHVNTRKVGTVRGQENVFGKLLWLSVRTVVILTENMRLVKSEGSDFRDLLGRLRDNECTPEDHALLNTRLLSRVNIDWTDDRWREAPIIVSDNAVKDAFNERLAIDFARRTGQEINWYYAVDQRVNRDINDDLLRDYLVNDLHSGQTNQRMGKIPLVLGMPVVVSSNFDVNGGIVNGSYGKLKQIRYTVDSRGERHAVSCVVEVDKTSDECLPHLPAHHVVTLPDTVSMTFIHPFSRKRCTIKRTQMPILPGFAITAHKAQGRTMENAIVDVQSCHDPEAPYVMLSRVTSIEGLIILRPFNYNKINNRNSQDKRKEYRRLEYLRLKTVEAYGDEREASEAKRASASIEKLIKGNNMSFYSDSSYDNACEKEKKYIEVSARRLEKLQKDSSCLESAVLLAQVKLTGGETNVSKRMSVAAVRNKRKVSGSEQSDSRSSKRPKGGQL